MNLKENNNYNLSSQKLKQLLSESELEILNNIKKGLSSTEIATIRNCSPRTVEKHRSNIIKKLGLGSSSNTLIIWTLKNSKWFDT